MVSVCMATYNGAKYIREQIDSILLNLSSEDELVISDDLSSDTTVNIIKEYNDNRIRLLLNNSRHGVAGNFENALRHANGEIIFFSDQDDVWLPGKIKEMSDFLRKGGYDIVTCNCALTDSNLQVLRREYYTAESPVDRGALKNFIKDLWLGSCMAIKRDILKEVMPFPPQIIAHDLWIAIYGQLRFKCGYYDKPLQLYRRHDFTVSFADGKSSNSLKFKLEYRAYLAIHLVKRILKNSIRI